MTAAEAAAAGAVDVALAQLTESDGAGAGAAKVEDTGATDGDDVSWTKCTS